MGAGVCQEIAMSLKAETKRRRDDGLAHDRHVMQGVVESKWKSDDQQRRSDLDMLDRGREAGRVESVVNRRLWQR